MPATAAEGVAAGEWEGIELFSTVGWNMKRAFTLVELLVVIAIIGVLVGLLLPAVQAARESARRTECANNLKQIGLALHTYEGSHRTFPAGWIDSRPLGDPNYEGWAWSALILPYIEQGNLHTQLGVKDVALWSAISGVSSYRPLFETKVPMFICPSDAGDGPAVLGREFDGGFGVTSAGWQGPVLPGISNYVGSWGHLPIDDATVAGGPAMLPKPSGLFWRNSRLPIAQVRDGTSNTVAVGERESRDGRAGVWIGVRDPQRGDGPGSVSSVVGGSIPLLNQSSKVRPWDANDGPGEGFSSMHPSGAQFVFCDGSVRLLASGIQHNWTVGTDGLLNQASGVYQRLLTRNDELPTGDY